MPPSPPQRADAEPRRRTTGGRASLHPASDRTGLRLTGDLAGLCFARDLAGRRATGQLSRRRPPRGPRRLLGTLLAGVLLAGLAACGEPEKPAGFAEGFEQGRAEGAAQGFAEGRHAGHAEGFEQGRAEGGAAGRATALQLWIPLGFALGLLLGAGGLALVARRPLGEALAVRRTRRRLARWMRTTPQHLSPALRRELDAFFERLARLATVLNGAPGTDAAALGRGLEALAAQAVALHGLRARLAEAVAAVTTRSAPNETAPSEARARRDEALQRAQSHLATCEAELAGLDDLIDHLRLQAVNVTAAGDPLLGASLARSLGAAADDLERAVRTATRELADT